MKSPRALALFVASSVALSCSSMPSASTRLRTPRGEVLGVAVLRSVPGGTIATINVAGLNPRNRYRGAVNAGTCRRPSASTLALPLFEVDADGRARATAPLLFRGEGEIELGELADGEHVVRIFPEERDPTFGDVACGTVPPL